MVKPALPAFNAIERERAHELLALKVAKMMGRKMEEGDWSTVYCGAKGIPDVGWSNLNIDVVHGALGVEHKMLAYDGADLGDAFGGTFMHPSLTRSIRIESTDADPNDVMRSVFEQYTALVERRRAYVADKGGVAIEDVDLRTGWLLWQTSLRQFLYFEEENAAPTADDYYAVWNARARGGSRKSSKNLWIYERETGIKRYSVTTSAGIKIQPYFDVPLPNDPNAYLFTVTGEQLPDGRVRLAATERTHGALLALLGDVSGERLSAAIIRAAADLAELEAEGEVEEVQERTEFVTVTADAYEALNRAFPGGVNDEHRLQLLADFLAAAQG